MCASRAVLLLAVAAWALAATPAQAQPRRVAVLDFANTAKDPAVEWVGPAVAETLTTKLNVVRALSLIERRQLSKVLEEQRLSLSDLVDPSQAVKVGKLVGAEQVVLGAYTVFGQMVRFTARFVVVETGAVVATSQVDGLLDRQNPGGFFMTLDRLAEATIDSLNTRVAVVQGMPQPAPAPPSQRIEPTPRERAELARVPSASLDALEAFGKGVAADQRHAWREALRHFEQATRLDGNYAEAWRYQGDLSARFGHYSEALRAHERALQLFERLGKDREVALVLSDIGVVHQFQGRHTDALSYFERSRKLRESLGDEPGLIRSLNNIGFAHESQGRYAEALSHYERSRGLSEKLGDEAALALVLNNIGAVHARQGRFAEALAYLERSRGLGEKLGNEPLLALVFDNMGVVLAHQGRSAQALFFLERAVEIADRFGLPARAEIRTRRDFVRQQVR